MDIPDRHLRRRRKVAVTEFLDEEQQETLVNKFSDQARAQEKFYRVAFAVVLALPSPTYIFSKRCRSLPKLSVLSLVSLLITAFSLKSKSRNVPKLRLINIALAFVIALQVFLTKQQFKAEDTIWLFPLMASVTSVLTERWINQVRQEITKLNNNRYELRGV